MSFLWFTICLMRSLPYIFLWTFFSMFVDYLIETFDVVLNMFPISALPLLKSLKKY